jgi:hypothetical protein
MALTKLINEGYLKKVSEAAIVEISKDREQFDVIYKLVYEYVKGVDTRSTIYISDKYAIMEAQNDLLAIYEKQLILYTSNPFLHSIVLANTIHEKTRNKYVKLKTIKEHEEFAIDYQGRQLISVFKLDNYKTTTHKLISAQVINGLNYFPAEIEIIDIYHQLYLMNEYSNNVSNEEKLYNQVIKRRECNMIGGFDKNGKIDEIGGFDKNGKIDEIGGFDKNGKIDEIGGFDKGNCREARKEITEHIKITLVKDFIRKKENSNKFIVLGVWAYNWMLHGNEICANREKLQIMSILTPDEVLKTIRNYVNDILQANITMREQDLYIPKDFRTMRYTFYMTSKTKHGIVDKPFMDLFNCANFEIIPYDIKDGLQIANKWVLLRFMFIDVWIIRFIKNIGLLDANVLDQKLTFMWKIIDYFRTLDESTDAAHYTGTFISYDVAKKMDALKQKKFFPPYYPEEAINKYKK